MAVARRALARVFGREPALIGCGGSIPVAASFRKLLGLDTLLVGFGLDDDRVHSPNEKFELVCYRRGIETHAAMLAEFAALAS
jgi:acetylornithine deacetylase/succinyl-diaminopimelate desuccinylase-like protein